MPGAKSKLKTKKAAAKRFKRTGTGKLKFQKPGRRHNLGNKSRSTKLAKHAAGFAIPGDSKPAEHYLPYQN